MNRRSSSTRFTALALALLVVSLVPGIALAGGGDVPLPKGNDPGANPGHEITGVYCDPYLNICIDFSYWFAGNNNDKNPEYRGGGTYDDGTYASKSHYQGTRHENNYHSSTR